MISNNSYRMQCVGVSEENQGMIMYNNDGVYLAKGSLDDLKLSGACFGDAEWEFDLNACVNFPGLH
jgi:hypothetical protein